MPLEVVFWDTCSSNIRNWFHMLNITKPKAWAKLRTKNYIPFAHLPFHQQQFLQHLSQVSMGPAPVYRVTSGKKIQKSDYVFFGEIPSHIYIRQMEVKRIFGRLLLFKTFWVNWWTLFKTSSPRRTTKKTEPWTRNGVASQVSEQLVFKMKPNRSDLKYVCTCGRL